MWKNALRQRTHRKMRERLKDMPPHFRTVWRPSYTKPLSNLDENKLRAATQYLTGHCELNYHLNKYKPQSITKICPHCSMEEETINHFIGQCPMWFNRRGRSGLISQRHSRSASSPYEEEGGVSLTYISRL